MDELVNRFIKSAPVAVMTSAIAARVLTDSALNDIFERNASSQYTRELTFSTLVDLMTKVAFRTHDSIHAAYQHTDGIPVSLTSVYNKLGELETRISEALVEETAQAMQALLSALGTPVDDDLQGMRLRTLDGNFLAGTDHRLQCLRGCGAAALPGMSLVVREVRTGLLTNLIACEDAYTSERSLWQRVLSLVQPNDLWLSDRNFCTDDYLSGFAERDAYFLIRYHAGTKLHALGEEKYVGSNASGDIFEQKVRVGLRECRCLIVRLHKPLRDGLKEIRLLTNVPRSKVGAKRLAELYRTRWAIEKAFQELTDYLRCEVSTLGYPKAALFAFAMAMLAYNLLVAVKAALASGQGTERVTNELSSYHLATEVAVVTTGMSMALPEKVWLHFARMPLAEFARWLRGVAKDLNWQKYRKKVRGPKKPAKVQRTSRGAHRSTARVLKQRGHG
jgi:IS4 transposase